MHSKTPFYLAAVAAMLMLGACSSNDAATSDAPTAGPVMITPDQVNAGSTAPATNASGARLNPPHGEPGHRCDIAVGEPLDAAPATPAAGTPAGPQAINLGAQPVTVTPSSSAGGNSGRINPPHGEPGHDCAVPVGEPLP